MRYLKCGTLVENQTVFEMTEVSFAEKYEVIIVGLGTAGAEAAIYAADLGMKALGVEASADMGGQYVVGGLGGCFYGSSGGVWEKYEQRAAERNQGEYYNQKNNSIPARSDSYRRECERSGLKLLLRTVITGVYLDGKHIVGIRVCREGKIFSFGTDFVIDCTGNGLVCRMAGCAMRYGRKVDEGEMSFSKVVIIEHEKGKNRPYWTTLSSMVHPTAEEYTRQTLLMSAKPPCLWEKKSERVYREINLLGMREEGHVETEEILSLQDCLWKKKFSKVLFYTLVPADLVRADGNYALEDTDFILWRTICGMSHFGFSAPIPYGSILPKGIDNLLIACKAFGVTHGAASGLRVVRVMKKLGEGAVTAVWTAMQEGKTLRTVSFDKIEQKLRSTGCFAEEYNVGYVDLSSPKNENGYWKGIQLPDRTEIISALSQDLLQNDGLIDSIQKHKHNCVPQEKNDWNIALFACWHSQIEEEAKRKKLQDGLYENMIKGGRYGGNFAVALALTGDKRACRMLRSIVQLPGKNHPLGCDSVTEGTFPQRFKALFLLGWLQDEKAIPLLWQVLQDYGKNYTEDLPLNAHYQTYESYRYEATAYALSALLHICSQYENQTERERLIKWKEGLPDFYAGLSVQNGKDVLIHMVNLFLSEKTK